MPVTSCCKAHKMSPLFSVQNLPSFTQSKGQVLHVTCHSLTFSPSLLLAPSVGLPWPYAVLGALQACLRAFSYTLPSAGNAGTSHRGLLHACSAFTGQGGWAEIGEWGFDAVIPRLPATWGPWSETPDHVRITCWDESLSVPVSPQSYLHV